MGWGGTQLVEGSTKWVQYKFPDLKSENKLKRTGEVREICSEL